MTDVNQLIIDQLDIWTAATEKKSSAGRGNGGGVSLHGIKKLRELILELAVRGKLVPHDTAAHSSEMLLAEFRHRRMQGIKAKRYKKQNIGEPLLASDQPFDVPASWSWSRLGEIGFVFSGNSVSARAKAEKFSSPDGLPFIATKNVGYGFESLDYDVEAWIPVDEPKFKVALANTPLICSEGGSAGKKCGLTDRDVCFGNKLFACEFYGEFVSEFLLAWYQCPSFFSQFSQKMTGIIGGISLAKFLRLPVPVPPISEQHRIVAKVDELMALCDALERQAEDSLKAHQTLVETCLATLTNSQSPEDITQNWTRIEAHFDTLFTTEESIQTLRDSIMQLAVQGALTNNESVMYTPTKTIAAELAETQKAIGIKPGKRGKIDNDETLLAELPKRWRRVALQDLALQITDGTHLTPKYTPDGSPFLSAKNVKPFRFLPDEHRFVSEADFESYRSNRKPQRGDILLTRVGAGIGEAAVIDTDMEFAIYVSVCLIKPFERYINSDYLCLWLNSPEGRNLMTQKTYGRGASQGNLNLELIRTLSIPVPPLPEQIEIVRFTKELFLVCDQLSIRCSESLVLAGRLADTLTSKIH